MRKRLLSSIVAGLFGIATYVAPPATADGGYSPITMENGDTTFDVFVFQAEFSSRLGVENMTDRPIVVKYHDPTYGAQARRVAPGQDTGDKDMCADLAYQETSLVTVIFDPDSSAPTTGTGRYASFDVGGDVKVVKGMIVRAHKALRKAFKALKKAKRSHQKARVIRAKKRVRNVRERLRHAKATMRDIRREQSYCAARRLD